MPISTKEQSRNPAHYPVNHKRAPYHKTSLDHPLKYLFIYLSIYLCIIFFTYSFTYNFKVGIRQLLFFLAKKGTPLVKLCGGKDRQLQAERADNTRHVWPNHKYDVKR